MAFTSQSHGTHIIWHLYPMAPPQLHTGSAMQLIFMCNSYRTHFKWHPHEITSHSHIGLTLYMAQLHNCVWHQCIITLEILSFADCSVSHVGHPHQCLRDESFSRPPLLVICQIFHETMCKSKKIVYHGMQSSCKYCLPCSPIWTSWFIITSIINHHHHHA